MRENTSTWPAAADRELSRRELSRREWLAAMVALGAALPAARIALAAPRRAPDDLPRYERLSALTGRIEVGGAASACAILAKQGDAFRSLYPGVQVALGANDVAGALASFQNGTTDIVLAPRTMDAAERSATASKLGRAPLEVAIGLDAFAIFVHKSNPIAGLGMTEISALFGAAPSGRSTIRAWGELGSASGLSGDWTQRTVSPYGYRDGTESATIMRRLALAGGAFRADLHAEPASSSIVNGVGADVGGVGYADPSYATRQTRVVPLSRSGTAPFLMPTAAGVADGSYPLGWRVYAWINANAGADRRALVRELLRFAISQEGQAIVARERGMTIDAAMAREGRASLG